MHATLLPWVKVSNFRSGARRTGAGSTLGWRLIDPEANRGQDRLQVQAVLLSSESSKDDGGFFAVPGSHLFVSRWARYHRNNPAVRGTLMSPTAAMQIPVPPDDPLKDHGQKITARSGSLIIWDSRLAHCNYSNNSAKPRLVQYLKMKRADDPAFAPMFDQPGLLPRFIEMGLDSTGRRLLGLEPWP